MDYAEQFNRNKLDVEYEKYALIFKKRLTMRIAPLLSIFLLLSCSGQGEKNTTIISENIPIEQKADEPQSETIELLGNGLTNKMTGEWLTAVLPDSILKTREILRWKNVFYGDLLLSIKDNDTLVICGNMDWGSLKYKVDDNKSITTTEEYKTRVVYSPEKDIVYRGSEPYGPVYKRPPFKDFEKIIANEKLLMEYVINLLFKNDFLPPEFAAKIKYISLGLETYTPFTFDAIGIENQNGELEYFGWKYSGDTLNLYKTSSTFDDDSGFISYKQGELDKQYFKSK
ncbi:MAG: hypothetical protein U5K79_22845 [Cyclobacteriaceae bacterium]|nr:hypothetical protein [Cyclobacteriaceae bacterium]